MDEAVETVVDEAEAAEAAVVEAVDKAAKTAMDEAAVVEATVVDCRGR